MQLVCNADTTNTKLKGTPIFKMGSDTYDNDTIAFNFKSKRDLSPTYTQSNKKVFLSSKIAKRDGKGDIYLEHGRYTTCDKDCPDFYIALQEQRFAQEKMLYSDLLISSLPMFRCLLPFLMDSFHSPKAIQVVSSCLLMEMKVLVDSI